MEKIRACPICPRCGSKKFDRMAAYETTVKCVSCGRIMAI